MVLKLKTHYSIQISVFRKGFYLNMENYTFVLTPANRKAILNYCKLEERYHIFTIADTEEPNILVCNVNGESEGVYQ